MTIPDSIETALGEHTPPEISQVELTEEEVLTAVGLAACDKLGFNGEYQAEVRFSIITGEIDGAEVRLTPLPPGTTGKPPIVYRTIHRAGAETVAEAAAGPTGELVSSGMPARNPDDGRHL